MSAAGGSAGAGLPLHEAFYSWQGEGVHLGRAAFFIRTLGCPVRCAWCDAAGTWHPDYVPPDAVRADVDELAGRAAATACEFAVVTGGEPAVHDLGPLTAALAARSVPAHLETCGAFPLRGEFAWVTLSPKWEQPPLEENLARADELKLIVEDATSIDRWIEALGTGHFAAGRPVWLHPEWGRRDDPAVAGAICDAVKRRGAPFRAGYQVHKLYRADERDPASRPPAPLGGDPARGY